MKTIRYNIDYRVRTAKLLSTVENAVNLPSDIFFEITRALDAEDDEKLGKLLSKVNTVLAVEDDEVVGIASMDKDGSVGIFAVREGETYSKACRLLSNYLNRNAEKKELPYIFVLPVEGKQELFNNFGYQPYDNESGDGDAVNEFMLAKKIENKAKVDLPAESVKRFTLDQTSKITVEGHFSSFPIIFFGMACFFVLLLTVLTISLYTTEDASTFIPFFVIVGLIFAAATGVLIYYIVRGRQLKQTVLGMRVTNGVITSITESVVRGARGSSDDYYRVKYTHISLQYVFYDDDMQKHEAEFTHKYSGVGPYFYEGQELIVAYSESESYILEKYTIVDTQYALSPTTDTTVREQARTEQAPIKRAGKKAMSKYVPLNAAKRYYAYSLGAFIGIIILLAIGLLLSIPVANQSGMAYGRALQSFYPLWAFGLLIMGVPCAYYFIVPTRAKAAYKKLLRKPDASVTDGKLCCSAQTYKAGKREKFYCEYSDGKETKRVRVPSTFASNMVKYGNAAVKVIFDKTKAVVLIEKGYYPDIFLPE